MIGPDGRRRLLRLVAVVVMVSILTMVGCSDDGKDNETPRASAGPDQTITLAADQTTVEVTLDGSGSSAPDGTIEAYLWTGPPDAPDPDDVMRPTVILEAGERTFTLVVIDDEEVASAPDTVLITVQEMPDVTADDLENMAFTFADGVAFDATLENRAVTLVFGEFDAGTAPFRLEVDALTARGMATLQSPLALTYLQVEEGLPFSVDQITDFEAETDDADRLTLENPATGATSTSDPGTVSDTPPAAIPLSATLSADPEVPPVMEPTAATGSAILTLHATQTEIDYTLDLTGPFTSAITQAHIHIGPVGEAGPVIFFLCATDQSVPVPAPAGSLPCPASNVGGIVTGILIAADLMAQPEVGVDTFADAVEAITTGNTYVNVHTTANASGEIRGQIEPVEQPNQAPTVNAGANQTVTLEAGQSTIEVTLDGSASSDPDGAIVAYTWTGTPDPDDVMMPTVTLEAGVHTFTLVVTDDDGTNSAPDSVEITVDAASAIDG